MVSRSRTAGRAWAALAIALLAVGVLVAGMTGWLQGASTPARGSEAAVAGPSAPASSLLNEDGTVGPIVALGDSITAGLLPRSSPRVGPERPSRFSWYGQALRAEPRLLDAGNAGIPGDRTSDMLGRFAEDVVARDPDVVVILGGTNDLTEDPGTEAVMDRLERLVTLTRETGAEPVLGTVPPRAGPELSQVTIALNEEIRAFAEEAGIPVIDFFAVLADEDGSWRSGYSYDGIHPTRAGARAMAELATRTLLAG